MTSLKCQRLKTPRSLRIKEFLIGVRNLGTMLLKINFLKLEGLWTPDHLLDRIFCQGALAQRRSNFQGNQFPVATEAARKAAVAPLRNRAFSRNKAFNPNKPRVGGPVVQKFVANGGGSTLKKPFQQANSMPKQKPQTLDALFANMKEQRMKAAISQQNTGSRRNVGGQPRLPWARNHRHQI
ncbi:uncharacterized protein LOC127255443 isoform X2 [Andrographis paniculata]|uniref:uncharacterized protein LOC127255443 isoform X2 n=1 Tax=Andrographis paniculata TaxID=175694 RepID=UPI0021E8B7A1|nr:uncharacterized protein LOC127255443 isoform X2 [Andrographis paniculata]XP_051136920.1 uncharacterized protein LOC127255443 isoform X2 [Andrographis paniculata]